MDQGPQACGRYWTPISKNDDGIPQYVQAMRTVLTLLSIQLEPNTMIMIKNVDIHMIYTLQGKISCIDYKVKPNVLVTR